MFDLLSNLKELLVCKGLVVVISKKGEQGVHLNPFATETLLEVLIEPANIYSHKWHSKQVEVHQGGH